MIWNSNVTDVPYTVSRHEKGQGEDGDLLRHTKFFWQLLYNTRRLETYELDAK